MNFTHRDISQHVFKLCSHKILCAKTPFRIHIYPFVSRNKQSFATYRGCHAQKKCLPLSVRTPNNGPSEKTRRTNVSFFEWVKKMVDLQQATCGITYAALHMPRTTGNCPHDANKTGYSSHPAKATWGQRQARPHMPRITGNSPLRRTMGYSAHPTSVLLTVLAEPASVRLCNVNKNFPYRDDSTVSGFLCSSIRRFAA